MDASSLPDPVPQFLFFGIVGTWMEEDIIGASVSNAFHQGCQRVFVVDNSSTDRTVQNALWSGATLARSYRTDGYDEPLRISVMNDVMREVTETEGGSQTWWLWFDADEFAHGPGGGRIVNYLRTLDDRFRLVGARYFNHLPTTRPQYVAPFHPLDFQPLFHEFRVGWCSCGHRKHPLVRLDRDRPYPSMLEGFHLCHSPGEALLEAPAPVFVHHFPFREREVTKNRLTALCATGEGGSSRNERQDRHEIAAYGGPTHASRRFAALDAVYEGRWNSLVGKLPGWDGDERSLQLWPEVFDRWDLDVWYSKAELAERTGAGRNERGSL